MRLSHAFTAFFLWVVLAALPLGAQAQTKPVLDTAELNALLELPNVRVIDIRPPDDYKKSHIPQAVSAPYGQWRGPAENPGLLIQKNTLQQLLRDIGVQADEHIVVYSSGDSPTDFGAAARVYWTLKYAGLDNLSLVDGGFQQWQRDALPTNAKAVTVKPSNIRITLNTALVATEKQLLEQIHAKPEGLQLVDARPTPFYEGHVKAPTATTPGTLAGAGQASYEQWFSSESATLKPTAEILQLIKKQGLDQAQQTVSFCNTGHWAATNWFVLSEIGGLSQVQLYPESMTGWTQATEALPMDNTPSRAQQIRIKFNELFSKQ